MIFKSLLQALPIVGNVIDNIDSLDGGKGNVQWTKLAKSIIRLLIAGTTIYLVVTGKLDPEALKGL